MTSDFFPSNREHDPADASLSHFSVDVFAEDSGPGDASDHWIDEALRTVPMPEGFLLRMGMLAQSVQPESPSSNLA